MRKLMWFTVGFGAACALGVWVVPDRWIILPVFLAAGLAVLCARRRYGTASVILAGCFLGLCWYSGFARYYLIPARTMDGTAIETTVTATDYSYETDYGGAVDGEVTLEGRKYQIRVYVNSTEQLCPGDTITGTFLLRYTAPGGLRDTTYHAGDGILFLGYERGTSEKGRTEASGMKQDAAQLRHHISQRLQALFSETCGPFARALLLGDDNDLDYSTDTALKISGIRHVIAVSGLHVAILYTMLRALTLNRRWLTALLGFPALAGFCAVAGFTPSVTRACIMVGLMILAQLMDKEYDPPTALSFAVLVMLVVNPLVITSISFQMSVACVTGILLFQMPVRNWMQEKWGIPRGRSLKARLKRWLISSVSVSLSATVLTIPMSAYYFGAVSLIGVLTNLLSLWAVSLAFYGIVAVCLVSLFWMEGAALLAQLVSLPMAYVLWMAKLLASFPLAAVYTQSVFIILWLVFVYVLLAVFLLSPRRRPRELACCAVLGLCLALLGSWNAHRLSDTHFTALDVGQGQSLILHHQDKTFLIDCGGSNDEIAANTAVETLLSRGITHLDGIILTHGDRDHAGGIPYLLSRIDSSFIMLPVTTAPETVEMIKQSFSGKLILVGEEQLIDIGEGIIRIFGPIYAAESNENSLCVLFESENCAILVTGDRGSLGELVLLHDADIPEVDLLMAGHHGSGNSTSGELLRAVSPETVFISVGKSNGYGHPAQSLLDRLDGFECEVYRTDLHGTLIFRR